MMLEQDSGSGLWLPSSSRSVGGSSLDRRVGELLESGVRRVRSGVSGVERFREPFAPSGLVVDPSYGNAVGAQARGALRRAGRAVMFSALLPLVACGGGSSNVSPRVVLDSFVSPVSVGSDLGVSGSAVDPDGSVSSVEFSLGSDSVVDRDAPYEASLSVPSESGVYEVRMVAVDDRGASGSDARDLEVIACELNPAVSSANDAGVPAAWVSVLGDDCVLDSDERWFVEDFLPSLRSRTSDLIAQSYPERFVDDDGEFESDEMKVLKDYFFGRVNHAGVLITPGYFGLFDANESNPETRLEIANASWVPLFSTPFSNRVLPTSNVNGYAEPYFSDGGSSAAYSVLLPNRGDGATFLDLLGGALSPRPDYTVADAGPAAQFKFHEMQELVNGTPNTLRVEHMYTYELSGVRNAAVSFVALDRSPSLGHRGLEVHVAHADDERLLVEVGDTIEPEEVWGYLEPDLVVGLRAIWALYSESGHVGPTDSTYRQIDMFDLSPSDPEARALLSGHALWRAVDLSGEVVSAYLGGFQDSAVKDGRLMSLDGTWAPLVYDAR